MMVGLRCIVERMTGCGGGGGRKQIINLEVAKKLKCNRHFCSVWFNFLARFFCAVFWREKFMGFGGGGVEILRAWKLPAGYFRVGRVEGFDLFGRMCATLCGKGIGL